MGKLTDLLNQNKKPGKLSLMLSLEPQFNKSSFTSQADLARQSLNEAIENPSRQTVSVDLNNIQPNTPEEQARIDSFQQREAQFREEQAQPREVGLIEYAKNVFSGEGGKLTKMLGGALSSSLGQRGLSSSESGKEFAAGVASSTPFIGGIFKEGAQAAREASTQPIAQIQTPIGEVDISPTGVGGLSGNLAFTATQYSAINKALKGLNATSKLGKLLGGSKIASFGANQAVDLMADTVIQSPREIMEAISEDKTLDEFGKNFLKQRAIDVAMNLVIGGTLEGVEALRSIKNVEPNIVDNAIKELSPENARIVREAIDTRVDVPLSPSTTEFGTGRLTKMLETDTLKQTDAPATTSDLRMQPEITEATTIASLLPPIDTSAKVLVDMPQKAKTPIRDRVERVYQEIFSKNVPFERISEQTKVQASNLNRVQGTIEYNVFKNQTNMNGEDIGKSIVGIFGEVPPDLKKDVFEGALLKHNIDRFREGKPVFGDTVDEFVSAQKLADIQAKSPIVEQKINEIVDYNKKLLNEWGVESGLISPDTAKMLNEMYPNYVPTLRAMDIPKSLSSTNQNVAQILKRAKGSERAILPLDQQMIIQTERMIKNSRRNELMNTLNDIYEQSGASRYVMDVKGSGPSNINSIDEVGKSLEIEPKLVDDNYVVNFFKDGEPKQMVVNKTLYKALETLNSDDSLNKVLSMVNKYATKPFKSVITGYNPAFAVSNIMRDIPTALTFSSNPLKMVGNVPEATKEMLTNGAKFRQFKAMGGTREGLIGSGKTVKIPNSIEAKGVMDKVKNLNPIKTVGDINNFTETLPRFSEYLNVLEKTGNPALALYRSAELTTDFSRYGGLTKRLDTFIPYLNPAVQGLDKFARTMLSNPLKTSAKAAAFITVPTVALDFINKDDEDYNNLPARERNLYFNIPFGTGDNKRFLRIPKSRELGTVFSSLLEWGSRASRGETVTGEEIKQAIEENFGVPVQPIWTPAKKAWEQIKDPEAYETNFWGGLIVPESQRKYSPGNQYDANTSGIAKAIGQNVGISPYVIDYFLSSYGGIISQTMKDPNPLDLFGRKFINDPVFKDESVNKFYDLLESTRKKANDFNKENNIPTKIVTPLERQVQFLQKYATQMSNIREQIRELDSDRSDKKVRELQDIINELAKKAIK